MRRKILLLFALTLILLPTGCGSGVKIKDENIRLSLGEEKTLTVSCGKDEKLEFSSTDPDIVSVDENGTVKALGNGIAVISVKGEKGFDAEAVVAGTGAARFIDENGNEVTSLVPSAADEDFISSESDITALKISIKGGGTEDVSISADRSYEIVVEKTPSDSSDKVTLKVADASVARIEGKVLKGVGRGKTTLTATAPNGVSAEMIVRVK